MLFSTSVVRRCFVSIIGLMLSICLVQAARAWDDQPALPLLPETEVEADVIPQPPSDNAANFSLSDEPPASFQDAAGNIRSIVEGSIFDSPPVTGYLAESSTTGTLIDVPDIQLPATVDTVTRSVIQDQQIRNFTDALRNVPAAVAVGDGLFADRIFLRGLEVRSRDFRKNGFLDPTYTPRDFANIERVEILKGPASVLYGSAAPSGTVNFITKKPVDDQFSTFNFQFGSFNQERYTLDTNGYVNSSGTVLYRFNGSYEDTESFRDFGFTERHLLAPSVRWLISDNTMLTWEAEIVQNDRRGDTGIPAVSGDPLALPISRYVGEPANDFLHTEDYRTSLVLNHRFDNDWSLYVGASTVFYEFPGSQTYPIAQVGPTQFARLRQDFRDAENSSSLIANLAGDWQIGGDYEVRGFASGWNPLFRLWVLHHGSLWQLRWWIGWERTCWRGAVSFGQGC